MEYDVRLEHANERLVAIVRRKAAPRELARVVPECCGLVWNVVRAHQIKGAGRQVALYWDDQINLDVGVEVEAPIIEHGEVVNSTIPAGTVVTTTHLGPYDRLHDAHRAVREWCATRGYPLAGPRWEIYGHWIEEWNSSPDQIRTDVFYLLKADA